MTGNMYNNITEKDGKKIIGEGTGFTRLRRITGYLVGGLERFNNAKRAEVADRRPHTGYGKV